MAAPIALALALPALFLHARYAPGVSFPVGSTDVDVELADVAIAAVTLAAAHAWRTRGPGALGAGGLVWVAAGALLALALGSALWGPLVTEGYGLADGLVSALKFVEYGLLAPAAAVIVRTRRDLELVLGVLAAWAAVATLVGLLQFLGLAGDLDDTPAGRRKPSFLGYHDFAALSAAMVVAAVALLAGGDRRRRLAWGAASAGALGAILAGSVAAAAGLVVATVAILTLLRRSGRLALRPALAAAGVVAVTVAGTAAMRSADLGDFVRFLGLDAREESAGGVETYSHRAVLSYIGVRIAADSPLLGAGWQGSQLEASYAPYLDDARRRFPDVAEEALPSPDHPWGVQNAYVQAAADMGVAGLAALIALLAAAAAAAVRAAPRLAALVALGWLSVVAFELAALGLVPGVPIVALLWLAAGLAVASPAVVGSREE